MADPLTYLDQQPTSLDPDPNESELRVYRTLALAGFTLGAAGLMASLLTAGLVFALLASLGDAPAEQPW